MREQHRAKARHVHLYFVHEFVVGKFFFPQGWVHQIKDHYIMIFSDHHMLREPHSKILTFMTNPSQRIIYHYKQSTLVYTKPSQ